MVSIVLPTYNRKQILGQSIKSVLTQTYKDFELLIVDDCSTDGTEEYIWKNFEDDRITYIRNEKNLGASGSRNQGILRAKGDYIAFIDSDTEWMPCKLEIQMAVFHQNPDLGMVYSSFIKIYNQESQLFPPENIENKFLSGHIFTSLLQMPLVDTPTMLIPAWILHETGMFNEKLLCLEDYELSLRIAQKYKLYMCKEPTIKSYFLSDCVSMRVEEAFESRFYILKEFRKDYEDYGIFQNKLEELMQMAIDEKKEALYLKLMQKYIL
ncbi:MAG: glycosyltransferase family A protein [Lachnospiraceae bacterium]|nr:glycosyltransferase family A protein [Lachnospiraceae bacterium]